MQSIICIMLCRAFEITEYLGDTLKAGEGVGVLFDDAHHIADLTLIDDAD